MSAVSSVREAMGGTSHSSAPSSAAGATKTEPSSGRNMYYQKQIAGHFNNNDLSKEIVAFLPALLALYMLVVAAPWAAGVPDEAEPQLDLVRQIVGWVGVHVLLMYTFRSICHLTKWPGGLMFADTKWRPVALTSFALTALGAVGFVTYQSRAYINKSALDKDLRAAMDEKKPQMLARAHPSHGKGAPAAEAATGVPNGGNPGAPAGRVLVQQRQPSNILGEPMPNGSIYAPQPTPSFGSAIGVPGGPPNPYAVQSGMSAPSLNTGSADYSSLFA